MKIKTGTKEVRQVTTTIELRGVEESEQVIEGYALKFDKWSDDLGWFREKLASDSLEKTDMSNVTALFNHDESKILGRSGINLEMEVDNIGLRFRVKPTDTTYSRDLMENIRSGVINQCSFAFTVSRDKDSEEWRENAETGLYERTIRNIDKLYDVSVVTTPAYPDTEAVVGARSKELVESIEENKRSILEEQKAIELMKLEAEAYA